MSACRDCGKATPRHTDEGFLCLRCHGERIRNTGTELEVAALECGGLPWQKHGKPTRVYLNPAEFLDIKVTVNGRPTTLHEATSVLMADVYVSGNELHIKDRQLSQAAIDLIREAVPLQEPAP